MEPIDPVTDAQIDELFSEFDAPTRANFKEALNKLADINFNQMKQSKTEVILKIKNAKAWVLKAEESIEDAKLLFSQKRYSGGVRSLNHSVELLCKASGITYYDFPVEALKGFSHNTPKLFFEAARKPESVVMKELITKTRGTKFEDVDAEEKKVMELDRRKKIANGTEEEIKSVVALANFEKEKIMTTKDQINAFILRIPDVFGHIMNDKTKESLKLYVSEFKPDYYASQARLFLISLITYPHKYYVEYPNDTVAYDENLGIVKAREDIIKIVEEEIEFAKELVATFEKVAKLNETTDSPPSTVSTSPVPPA
jgi:hypothetical protein